jgi:tetracycline repressor-like protein
MAVTGAAEALWQIANPPEQLAELYVQEPQLAHAAVEFPRKIERLALVFTVGLLNTPGDASTPSP